ncbi:hypothetical protein Efla_002503 [Eimeria flavescens]
MASSSGLERPWPALAPPIEAIHLRQSYNALRALLLPSEGPGCLESTEFGLSSGTGSPNGLQLMAPSLANPLRLQRASGLPPERMRAKQRTLRTSRERSLQKGSSGSVSRKAIGEAGKEWSQAAMRSSSWGSPCSRFSKEGTLENGGAFEASERKYTHEKSNVCGANGQSATATKSRQYPQGWVRKNDAFCKITSGKCFGDMGFLVRTGSLPLELGALMTRPPDCTCSGESAPFCGSRSPAKTSDLTAVVRSSSTSEGDCRKCEGEKLFLPDYATAKALRIEALKRVRQRLGEERLKQQRQQQQVMLLQQQQRHRSLVLIQQLRQQTLRRLREKVSRKEQQRKQQQELLLQRVHRAEAQGQYCAQHRRELQKRLLQRNREIRRKIRMHAEESERIAAELEAFRKRTIKRLQKHAAAIRPSTELREDWDNQAGKLDPRVVEGPLRALMRLRATRRLRNEFFEV